MEVAAAARVSVATAYRYFPNPASLWVDVAARLGREMSDFDADLPDDVEDRIETVVRRIAAAQFADEIVWRSLLHGALERWFGQQELPVERRVPVRGTTRMDLTRTALAPLEATLAPEVFERLVAGVMMVYGLEAMVTARDACDLGADAATDAMVWAARTLVRGAVQELT